MFFMHICALNYFFSLTSGLAILQDEYVADQTEKSDDGPLIMNAFEMITLSQGLNLSPLFDRRQVRSCQAFFLFFFLLFLLHFWHRMLSSIVFSSHAIMWPSRILYLLVGTLTLTNFLISFFSLENFPWQDYIKRQTRFVSRKPASFIMSSIEAVAEAMGLNVQTRNFKVRFYSSLMTNKV